NAFWAIPQVSRIRLRDSADGRKARESIPLCTVTILRRGNAQCWASRVRTVSLTHMMRRGPSERRYLGNRRRYHQAPSPGSNPPRYRRLDLGGIGGHARCSIVVNVL